MKTGHWLGTIVLGVAFLVAGCKDAATDKSETPEKPGERVEKLIKANFAKMSDEDRPLAEAQKYCAVETDSKLGGMGMPIKVILNGEAVFICCKGCKKMAEKDPDKTLANVKELKAKSGS